MTGLALQPSSESVEFNNQYRAGIERETEVIRLRPLRDELIHHSSASGRSPPR